MSQKEILHYIDSTERAYGRGPVSRHGTRTIKGLEFEASIIRAGDRLIVAFPGTKVLSPGQPGQNFERALRQWLVNVKVFQREVNGYAVHEGYLAEAEAMLHDLRAALYDLGATRKRVVFVGHSAGGAIAQVAAKRLADSQGPQVDHVFSFSAPRVGDSRFAQRMRNMVTRLECRDDLVPQLPFSRGITGVVTQYAEGLHLLVPQMMNDKTLSRLREMDYVHAGRLLWDAGAEWFYSEQDTSIMDMFAVALELAPRRNNLGILASPVPRKMMGVARGVRILREVNEATTAGKWEFLANHDLIKGVRNSIHRV